MGRSMKVLKNKYNKNNGSPILPKEEVEKSLNLLLKIENSEYKSKVLRNNDMD